MDDIFFSKKTDTQELPPLQTNPETTMDISSKTKKHFSLLKAILLLLLVVVFVFSAGFGYIYNMMRKTDYNPAGHKSNVYVDGNDLMSDEKVVNILFIGVDARAQDVASRADSMILFSIDKNNRKIKLTSFMRDTWVDLPDRGFAKLNAACTYGGAQYIMDTIEYNFNIEIDSYVMVDFDAFVTIIDKLGGVNVEVTDEEAKSLRDEYFLKTLAGDSVHLDGNEALWYCRIRYLDSDFMRTFRQRKVITSIIEKAKGANSLELIGILKGILPVVETDLNPLDLTKLAAGAASVYIRYDIEQSRIPVDGTWENATKKGQSVLLADIGKNQKLLKDFLYSPDTENQTTETP